MTRPLAADDFATIARRQREIEAETSKPAMSGEACQCPTSPNAQGVDIKVHALSCPAAAAQYGAMFHMCELLSEEELHRMFESACLR